MPAWFYVLAAAAVLFVAWVAFARRWVHAVWYSWRQAAHAYQEVEAEFMPALLQGSMMLTEEIAYWNGDWREQTRVELSPEALDRAGDFMVNTGDLLAAPPREFLTTIPGTRMTIWAGGQVEFSEEPPDPGPGGDARLSTTPPPGPDQRDTHYQDPPSHNIVCAYEPERCPWPDGHPPEPSRLADAGDVAAAHVAHPSPDWLAAQMADLFAWVRLMVPQVTGWSVGA